MPALLSSFVKLLAAFRNNGYRTQSTRTRFDTHVSTVISVTNRISYILSVKRSVKKILMHDRRQGLRMIERHIKSLRGMLVITRTGSAD
jgi:hypothetical protein